ncbi:eukaryotic initiation factor 4E [Thraustotheca clavata]|uniref:proteasome endopeptidase complex n=1 Tax=Thraustotheca clavata TaxID=74557 RepID=A0A1V9ZW98_9STRA|nr:eukaryotic initiation factor 4E [Thraustotheca clavata]
MAEMEGTIPNTPPTVSTARSVYERRANSPPATPPVRSSAANPLQMVIQRLQGECEILRTEKREIERKLSQEQQKNARILMEGNELQRRWLVENQKLQSECTHLKEKVRESLGTIEILTERIARTEHTERQTNERCSTLSDIIKDLEAEADRSRRTVFHFEQEMERMKDLLNHATMERDNLIERTEADAKRVRHLWEETLAQHAAQLASVDEKATKSKRENARLAKKLLEKTNQVKDYDGKLIQAAAMTTKDKQHIMTLENDVKSIKLELKHTQEQNTKLSESIQAMAVQLDAKSAHVQSIESKLQNTVEESQKLQRQLQEKEKEYDDVLGELDALRSELVQCLSQHETTIFELQGQISELNDRYKQVVIELEAEKKYTASISTMLGGHIGDYNKVLSSVNYKLADMRHRIETPQDNPKPIHTPRTSTEDNSMRETSIQNSYCFWYMKKNSGSKTTLDDQESYEKSIKELGEFKTIQGFWRLYNHLIRPNDLPNTTDYHLFKAGIKPMWEDVANRRGGKWMIRIRKGISSRYWEDLVLAIIGEQFDVGNEICGAVMSIRYNEDIISLWNRNADNNEACYRIRDTMRKLLNLPQFVVLEYKRHDTSLNDNSSFRNTTVWRGEKTRSTEDNGDEGPSNATSTSHPHPRNSNREHSSRSGIDRTNTSRGKQRDNTSSSQRAWTRDPTPLNMQHVGTGGSVHANAQASIIKLTGAVQGSLLRVGDACVLLNCGDPSPASPATITSMASVGIAQGTVISAILITDWKISSCGMLSSFLSVYNTHHNRRNKDKANKVPPPTVFMTHATKAIMPRILKEAKGNDYNVAFLSDSVQATVISLACGQPNAFTDPVRNTKMTITAHRAGHVAGGCLYTIEIDETRATFVDGFRLNGSRMLLPASIPTKAPHIAVLRGDYTVTVSETRTVIEREFCKVIHDVLNLRGKVVIPVFGVGCFFHDIQSLLQDYWQRMKLTHIPIYVTSDALVNPQNLPFHQALLADYYKEPFFQRLKLPLQKLPKVKLLQEPNQPMIIFSDGASITSGDTASVLQACGQDPNNLLVLSEFCTKGTVNHAFLNNIVCPDLSKSFHASMVCRVHVLPSGEEVDARDVADMARQIAPIHHLVLNNLDEGHIACLSESITEHHRVAPFSALNEDDLVLNYPRDISVRLRSNIAFTRGPTPSLLVAEPRKKIVIYGENSVRRLKKKKHTIILKHTWKYPKLSTLQRPNKGQKKRSRETGFGLSILLSNEADDDNGYDDGTEEEANVNDALDGIYRSLLQWLGECKYSIDIKDSFVQVGSIQVDVSTDWSINMRWSYDDDELASRVFGLAQPTGFSDNTSSSATQYDESSGYNLKAGEVSSGTTIIAVKYDGGVVLGADSRTSTGTYVANRVSDKLTAIHDRIYCCRSGSAADTQALSDYVRYFVASHADELEGDALPKVHTAATLFRKMCYENKDRLMAGIIVAGYDNVKGGQVYSIPLGGALVEQDVAIGGSGSTYIYGFIDAHWRPNMTKEECLEFVQKALSHAMARDGSSGGVIRTVTIDANGCERGFVAGDRLPFMFMDTNARYRRGRQIEELHQDSFYVREERVKEPHVAWKIPLSLFAVACMIVWMLSNDEPSKLPKFRPHEQERSSVRLCGVTKKIVLRDDQINDDFCDCMEDGLDETLTSACSNVIPVVMFPCTNGKKIPTTIVGDGICDCSNCEDEE